MRDGSTLTDRHNAFARRGRDSYHAGMASTELTQLPLWQRFDRAARGRRRNPVRLVSDYMAECLERWEDEKLDAVMQQQARRSGYRERDAAEIVRRYRQEKRARRAAS